MTGSHGIARDQLRAFVERIERLEEEKKTIADDIKDVYGEAKSMGFDTKILKMVISLRKKDEQERTEQELILDTYLAALGMIPAFERDEEVRPATAEDESRAKASGEQTEGTPGLQAAGPRREMRVGEAPALVSATSDDGRDSVERHAPNSPSDDDAIAAVKGNARLANVADVEPSSAPIAEQLGTGGDHVTAPGRGLVSKSPATFILRPNCRRPDSCGGYGANHCHACKVAALELETA